MAHSQLAHLADRANDAARAYEFKDDELNGSTLEHDNKAYAMNQQADLGKPELENRLHTSYQQCQLVMDKSVESQSQAHDAITATLEENQRDK